MATGNPFDILGDDDSDDPSSLIAKQELKNLTKKATSAPAPAGNAAASSKFPSKPAPPAQAARDAKSSSAAPRGSGRSGFRGGRGNRDFGTRDFGNREFTSDKPNGFSAPAAGEEGGANERAPHQQFYRSGPRREEGGANDRAPRRPYERHSGTGRGSEMKRDGSGRGNWGDASDEQPAVQEFEEAVKVEEREKGIEGEIVEQKENNKDEVKEEAEEDKEMTLEEYEKVREEKRKALKAITKEQRKVEVDKDLQTMQKLSIKKESDPIFIKLGSEKELKKKDADKDERAKKVVSINEFLKPAEGERGYGGRRGGRGGRGQARGGFGIYSAGSRVGGGVVPAFEDPAQFPTLGGAK